MKWKEPEKEASVLCLSREEAREREAALPLRLVEVYQLLRDVIDHPLMSR